MNLGYVSAFQQIEPGTVKCEVLAQVRLRLENSILRIDDSSNFHIAPELYCDELKQRLKERIAQETNGKDRECFRRVTCRRKSYGPETYQ